MRPPKLRGALAPGSIAKVLLQVRQRLRGIVPVGGLVVLLAGGAAAALEAETARP